MARKKSAYWFTTGLFCVMLGVSGFAHLTRIEMIAESMAALGYPAFVMTILGVAKLVGVVAVLAPGRPLLKEWAYAGFTFNLLGASASHVFAGDPVSEAARPLLMLILGAISYLLRSPSRRLSTAPTIAGTPALDGPP